MKEIILVMAGLVPSLIASLIFYLIQNRDSSPRLKVKFLGKSHGKNEFYTFFKKVAIKAKIEIIQYAEGFNTREPDGLKRAKNYIEDIRTTLKSNPELRWVRYQMSNPIDTGWKKLTDDLKEEFPDQFNQMLIHNQFGDHIMSIILIDPGTKKSKIFFLISRPENLSENVKASLAASTILVSRAEKFSEHLKNQISDTYDNLRKEVLLVEDRSEQ